MPRRRIVEEPTSRLAVWSRRCAVFSLAATALAIVILRAGLLEIEPALATLAAALTLAVLAIVLALGSFIAIWRDGIEGGRYAVTGLVLSIAILAYPLWLGARAYQLPMINDITTDAIDPPRFDVIARLRPRGTVDYAGLYAAGLQREAYPDIQPLVVAAPPQAAYEATLALINKRRWHVVIEREPQPGRRDGQIEAVARTAILGFRDDVVVRIRPAPDGARIDIRSASRYGRHDIGANAARVKALLDEIEEALSKYSGDARPDPKPEPKPAPKKGPAKR